MRSEGNIQVALYHNGKARGRCLAQTEGQNLKSSVGSINEQNENKINVDIPQSENYRKKNFSSIFKLRIMKYQRHGKAPMWMKWIIDDFKGSMNCWRYEIVIQVVSMEEAAFPKLGIQCVESKELFFPTVNIELWLINCTLAT